MDLFFFRFFSIIDYYIILSLVVVLIYIYILFKIIPLKRPSDDRFETRCLITIHVYVTAMAGWIVVQKVIWKSAVRNLEENLLL